MARILRGEVRWADLNPATGQEQAPKRSWVKISQVRTLSTERIGRRLGRAVDEEVARVIDGLMAIVG